MKEDKTKKTVKKKAEPKKTYIPKRTGLVVLIKENGDMIARFDGFNEYIKANKVPKGDYTAGVSNIKI